MKVRGAGGSSFFHFHPPGFEGVTGDNGSGAGRVGGMTAGKFSEEIIGIGWEVGWSSEGTIKDILTKGSISKRA